jgi:Xaa-Pro aminopeptidase
MGADKTEGMVGHDPNFPPQFIEFMRTGWAANPPGTQPSAGMQPRPEAAHHAKRRATLADAFPGETLIIPSGRAAVRSNDTGYRYRAGSDHVWLTGEQDPESVLVISAGGEAVLYTRPPSPRDTDEFFRDRTYGELWIGPRRTLAEKIRELDLVAADLAGLASVLDGCAPGRTRVLRGLDPAVDAAIRVTDPRRDTELAQTLAELRLVKDDWEIGALQDAIDATVRGFEDVARILPADRPVSERLIEGVFGLRARHDGNDVGYSSIVGAGRHAATLHWISNDGHTAPGELLLMDMGVEGHHLYTADVTRVVPVSGRFTPLQRQVYDIVYRAQRAGIAAIHPGVAFNDVHQACMRVLAEGLADLGVLPVSVDEAMDPERITYRRWSLHGFGHMLGLDVHDCAAARREKYLDGTLAEGNTLTVEPGLYFQPQDERIPVELRGIGVRIEDDVLVTATGAQVLSKGLPTAPDDVEQWLATQRAAGPRLPG